MNVSVAKPRTAAQLLASLGDGSRTPMPSETACVELLELCVGNDARGASGPGRLSRDEAIKWLRADYAWPGVGHDALDSVCRRLGRSSYAKP